MNGDIFSWSQNVGSVRGIRVRIHWTLLVLWLYNLNELLGWKAPVWIWILTTLLSFLCILLHEFGHCAAARFVGGSADEVILWPLGGLAFVQTAHHWRPRFIAAAGGLEGGRRVTTVGKCAMDITQTGGCYVNKPFVVDGNVVSAATWHDYDTPFFKVFIQKMRESAAGTK